MERTQLDSHILKLSSAKLRCNTFQTKNKKAWWWYNEQPQK